MDRASMMTDLPSSRCCAEPLGRWMDGTRLVVSRCMGCGSLWAAFDALQSGGRPWRDLDVSPVFATALRERRAVQAELIIDSFPELSRGRILDYGSGQGVFLRALYEAELDAWGVDLDIDAPLSVAPAGRLHQIGAPWALPEGVWDVVTMLDVLEHHPCPDSFLESVPGSTLLIKIPMADGPLTRAARLLARLGSPRLLEAIFLVDDISPHYVLFTEKGLQAIAERAGWRFVRRRRIAEVGRELPDRMRSDGLATSRAVQYGGRAIGAFVEAAASFWTDTEVALFERNPMSPGGVESP